MNEMTNSPVMLELALDPLTWFIIFIVVISIATIAYTLTRSMPTPDTPDGPDPATELEWTAADEDKIVPQIYGSRELAGNVIRFSDLRQHKIKADDVHAGWGYYADFVIAVCGVTSKMLEVSIGEEVYVRDASGLSSGFEITTGIISKNVGTDRSNRESNGYFTDGTQSSADAILQNITGDAIAYKGLTLFYARMKTSQIATREPFIGDNISAMPNYKFVVQYTPDTLSTGKHRIAHDWEGLEHTDANGGTDIKSGSPTVSISSGAYTFSAAQASAVVGDRIVWSSGGTEYAGYITAVNSSTTGTVKTLPEGSVSPADVAGATVSHVYHSGGAFLYSCNPVDVIYDLLVTQMGYSSSLIDTTSFTAAQTTLYDEGVGLSFAMGSARSAKDWIEDIERHMSGFVVFDETDGKFKINLMRDDYTPGDLDVITPSLYSELKVTRQGNADLASRLKLTWQSSRTWSGISYTLENPANRELTGVNKQNTVDFPFFLDTGAVSQILGQITKRQFYPLAALKFKFPVGGELGGAEWVPQPGEVKKIEFNELGVSSMIVRIMGVESDGSKGRNYEIEALEDIFGLGPVELITVPGSDVGQSDLQLNDPVRHLTILDTHYETTTDYSILVFAAIPATGATLGARVNITDASFGFNGSTPPIEIGTVNFTPTGTLQAAITDTSWRDRGATGIVLEDCIGVYVKNGDADTLAGAENLLVIERTDNRQYELIAFESAAQIDATTYRFTNLARGLWDDDVTTHLLGARAWVVYGGRANLPEVKLTNPALVISNGVTVDYSVTPYNALMDGPASTISAQTYGFLSSKSPNPIDLTYTGTGGGTYTVSWNGRGRQMGCRVNSIYGWDDNEGQQESGLIWLVWANYADYYDAADNAEVQGSVGVQQITGMVQGDTIYVGTYTHILGLSPYPSIYLPIP